MADDLFTNKGDQKTKIPMLHRLIRLVPNNIWIQLIVLFSYAIGFSISYILKQSKCWEGQKDISCCAFTFATTAAEETHIVCGQLLHPSNNDSKYEVSTNWLWRNCPGKQQKVMKTLRQKKWKKERSKSPTLWCNIHPQMEWQKNDMTATIRQIKREDQINWGRKLETLHQSRNIINIWLSQRERWGSSPLPPTQEKNKDTLHKNTQKTDKCHNPNVMIICTENFTGNENWQPEVQHRSCIGDPYSAWKWDGKKPDTTKL